MKQSADLVFDPTLAARSVRSYTSVPHYPLRMVFWTDLLLSRTMLPGTLTGLRGSLCLRLASTFNHRPDSIILHHYKLKNKKMQVILKSFSGLCLVGREIVLNGTLGLK